MSAFVTSVAGSFFAEYTLAVTPHLDVALALGFDIALLGAVAGSASPWGAPLAGVVYVVVAKTVPLHPPGAAGTAVLVVEGFAIVLIALLLPRGAFAWSRSAAQRRRRRVTPDDRAQRRQAAARHG